MPKSFSLEEGLALVSDTFSRRNYFFDWVCDMMQTHLDKSGDYGSESDPMECYTFAEEQLDRPGYDVVAGRIAEKTKRWFNLEKRGRHTVVDEPQYDSARDLAILLGLHQVLKLLWVARQDAARAMTEGYLPQTEQE